MKHPIDPAILTAAADAGARAATEKIDSSGLMAVHSSSSIYAREAPAREAFAQAAIDTYLNVQDMGWDVTNAQLKEQIETNLTPELVRLREECASLRVQVERAEKKLTSQQWVKFSERQPTLDDADVSGCVSMCGERGNLTVISVDNADARLNCWWRPSNLPVPIPPFVRWKRTLSDDLRDTPNLDAIWQSIEESNLMPHDD